MDFLVKTKDASFGKVILITGASSGLGKTFTDFFLKKGALVLACARRNTFKKNFYKSNNFKYYKVDLSNTKRIKTFIEKISKKFKKIDVLINNAGVAIPQRIEKLEIKKLLQSFQINLFAPAILSKEVLKIMKKRNYGRIINISSGGSVNCFENYFSYSSSKAALNTLTKTLSKEVKNFDIKINTMSPGPCKTSMFPNNKLSTKLSLPTIEYLASLKSNGPSGKFFWFLNEIKIFPDLSYINWNAPKKFKKK